MRASSDAIARRPHPTLAGHVNRYIGYRQHGFAAGIHRGLPSRYLTVTVDLIDASSSIGGLRNSAVLLRQGGHTHGIAVEVLPLGARELFGVPAGELAGMTVELDSVVPRYRGLAERLRERKGWADRFDLLDEMLCSQLGRSRVPGEKLARAWGELTQDLAVPVVAVAREVGWTRQHLSARFRRETGMPPRQLRRVLRLERACQLLRRPARPPYAQLAVLAGYYDQAHLLHDWGSLVGCRPEEWLAETLPSLLGEAIPLLGEHSAPRAKGRPPSTSY